MNNSRIWRAGLYIRLSKEDYDSKLNLKEESDSVSAQTRILSDFVNNNPDIITVDYYIDDGYSGSTANRPEFQRMIKDIEKGLIDCVIFKDSTRFMRNQAEAIRYRDEYFPDQGVRYICVIDQIDRLPNQQKGTSEFLMDSVKDLFAEYYIAESSTKVRRSLDNNRKNGLFIGSHAPYGYKKDPNDKHKLIIDEEAADVIKQIYRWFLDGESVAGIVRKLNRQGVDNPNYYKKSKGINVGNLGKHNVWYNRTVQRMLMDEVYIGNLVQGQTRKLSYKNKKCYPVPKEEQIIVNNTHEAIIDKATFDSVQALMKKGGHGSPTKKNIEVFSGFVICGDCGRKMSLKTNNPDYGEYKYYRCVTNTNTGLNICSLKPSISVDVLEKTVLTSIQKMARLAINLDRALKEIDSKSNNNSGLAIIENNLKKLTDELEKAEKEKLDLFSFLSDGTFTKEEYNQQRAYCNEKISSIKEKIAQTQADMNSFSESTVKQNEFVEHFKKYGDIDRLTRAMVSELIDSIKVYSKTQIEINFKFKDIFKNTVEYINSQK